MKIESAKNYDNSMVVVLEEMTLMFKAMLK